jgi:hypothetical protein
MGSKSTWMVDVGGDARVVGERGAQDEQAVAAAHVDGGHGDARPAEDAAGQRVGVGHQPLGLERGDDGGVDVLGEGGDLVAAASSAVADDDHRPLGGGQELDGPGQLRLRGRDLTGRHPPEAWPRRGDGDAGQLLDLVGEDEVGHVALHDGVLHGQGGQFGGVLGAEDGLAPRRHRLEGGGEVDLLERPRPDDLRLHLAGEGHDRHPVDLGVPQAGEQVGGAGAGDGEAGRGPARHLGVAGGGEGARPLVADADVGDAPVLLRPPQGVGQAQVGVADHAEDGVEAPLAEHVDHLVHERDAVLGHRQLDPQALVAPVLDGVGRGPVLEAGRGLAGGGVVLVGVPRADDVAVGDLAVAQGTALVRAVVVEGAVAGGGAGQADGPAGGDHRRDPSLLQAAGVDAHPGRRRSVPVPPVGLTHL